MIYVVTDGEYSDYHIEGVFLDKEKAYKYAELNDCIVEEYEPMDDAEIIVGRKITVDYRTKESGTMKISVKKCEIKPYYNPSTLPWRRHVSIYDAIHPGRQPFGRTDPRQIRKGRP